MSSEQNFELWVRILTFIPLVVCSIAAVALTLSKWLDLRPRHILSEPVLQQVKDALRAGHGDRALEHAQQDGTHASAVASGLVQFRELPRDAIQARAALLAQETARDVEQGLENLSLIAVLGPLFGLLGTVVGIVVVFGVLASADGASNAQELAGGIGTALYTTIAGLIVGIGALVAHRFLSARTERTLDLLDQIALDIIDLCMGHGSPEPQAVSLEPVSQSTKSLSAPATGTVQ